jgi:hypothetical protein
MPLPYVLNISEKVFYIDFCGYSSSISMSIIRILVGLLHFFMYKNESFST